MNGQGLAGQRPENKLGDQLLRVLARSVHLVGAAVVGVGLALERRVALCFFLLFFQVTLQRGAWWPVTYIIAARDDDGQLVGARVRFHNHFCGGLGCGVGVGRFQGRVVLVKLAADARPRFTVDLIRADVDKEADMVAAALWRWGTCEISSRCEISCRLIPVPECSEPVMGWTCRRRLRPSLRQAFLLFITLHCPR